MILFLKKFIAEIQYFFINRWRDYLDQKKMKDTTMKFNGKIYTYDNEYMVDYNPFHNPFRFHNPFQLEFGYNKNTGNKIAKILWDYDIDMQLVDNRSFDMKITLKSKDKKKENLALKGGDIDVLIHLLHRETQAGITDWDNQDSDPSEDIRDMVKHMRKYVGEMSPAEIKMNEIFGKEKTFKEGYRKFREYLKEKYGF